MATPRAMHRATHTERYLAKKPMPLLLLSFMEAPLPLVGGMYHPRDHEQQLLSRAPLKKRFRFSGSAVRGSGSCMGRVSISSMAFMIASTSIGKGAAEYTVPL